MRTSLPHHLTAGLRAAVERISRSPVLMGVVTLVGVVAAAWLILVVAKSIWVILLLLLTAMLIVPDLLWVWREHPEVVRRAVRFLTNQRTIRVLLYLGLAVAWYFMVW